MPHPDPESFDDYYELLGVDRTADRREIVAAYRDLVATYHPDVAERSPGDAPDEETTAALFTHLTRAREILSTETRRAEYDRVGHERYLLEHLDGSTLTPAEDDNQSDAVRDGASGTTVTGCDTEPGWYRAASPGAEAIDPDVAADRGEVVESDPETRIADLIDRDPVETAWVWFRRCWLLRGLVAAVSVVAAVLVGVSPLFTVAGGGALAVALTGGYSLRVLPRTSEPTTPPPSASVGILRPSVVDRLRRWAIVLLTLTTGLALVGSVREPSTVQSLRTVVTGGSLGTPWIPPGVIVAPKLVDPLNATLAAVFVLGAVIGTATAVFALSGSAWLALHGGHRTVWPPITDLLAVLAAVGVSGYAVPALRGPRSPILSESLPPDLAAMFGIVDSAPTGLTLGVVGTVLLLAFLVRYDPVRTSAATS